MRSCLIHLINNLYCLFFPERRVQSIQLSKAIRTTLCNSSLNFPPLKIIGPTACVIAIRVMEHGEGRNGSIIHSNNLSTIAMRYEAPLSDFYPRICYPFSTAMKFTFLLPASLYSFLFLLSYEMLFKHLFYYSICSKFPASRDS